jgi:hypothetical protein
LVARPEWLNQLVPAFNTITGLGTDIILGSHSFPVIGMSKGPELKIKIIISKQICKN